MKKLETVLVGIGFALLPALIIGSLVLPLFGWEAGATVAIFTFCFGIDVLFFGKKP